MSPSSLRLWRFASLCSALIAFCLRVQSQSWKRYHIVIHVVLIDACRRSQKLAHGSHRSHLVIRVRVIVLILRALLVLWTPTRALHGRHDFLGSSLLHSRLFDPFVALGCAAPCQARRCSISNFSPRSVTLDRVGRLLGGCRCGRVLRVLRIGPTS